MIGTYGTSPFKTADDFKKPSDFISYYCDCDGFFSRNEIVDGRMVKETFHVKGELAYHNRYFGMKDCYISQNSFLRPKTQDKPNGGRLTTNLKHLNALYVDIDCYKKGYTQEEVLFILENDYFGHVIPEPTFVVNSGRGLYLLWRINEDRNALPRWKKVEDYLIEQCAELGADPQARDAARILRVPFSVNSKCGEQVRIMRFKDVRYTLHEIIREHHVTKSKKQQSRGRADGLPTYPYGHATAKQRKTANWIASALQIALPCFENYQETADFIARYINRVPRQERKRKVINIHQKSGLTAVLGGRIEDLHTLMSMRKGDGVGRELSLFLCRLWAFQATRDSEVALSAALELNAALDMPHDKEYVAEVTKSAEKHADKYHYKNDKIIKLLDIKEHEQRELRYICGVPADAAMRKSKANRRAYLVRLEKEGKTTKRKAVEERRNRIATLLVEGKDKTAICEELSISTRTFDRDKAAIVADGLLERVKAELERKARELKETVQRTAEGLKKAIRGAAVPRRENRGQQVSTNNQSLYLYTKGLCPFCIHPCGQLSFFTENGALVDLSG